MAAQHTLFSSENAIVNCSGGEFDWWDVTVQSKRRWQYKSVACVFQVDLTKFHDHSSLYKNAFGTIILGRAHKECRVGHPHTPWVRPILKNRIYFDS